jgi:CheY-like chemotaxis protein
MRRAMAVVMIGQRFARPVLVVDDDDATRAAESAVLADGGFRVVQARDGEEALLAINIDPPAVVVLDIQMPGIDGPSFARELRMALRRVPLVVLTAADDPKREADRCNAEAYLRKPFDAPELVKVIRRFAS